ncbi:MAG: aminotransferase class I/II-fold pyridoxal phosphate-dependent enzyme [Actinobacteria bacterium]|nr:aminotransferase class I/II-fold pyridoxal phosphate-dependent enzyme [Actinomycetota bacterium]
MLAGLATGGCVLAAPVGHPELPLAASALGIPVRFEPLDGPVAVDQVSRIRPALTVLDRPGVTGLAWPLSTVRLLAEACADVGGALVVDETCASYLEPADSAVPLTGEVEGLVVVRSLSKGYCCGGLRVGFAVCSPGLATAARAVCPPLGVSALPVDVGLALLAVTPDVLVSLRARIAKVKPGFEARLTHHGLDVLPTDPRVPWVALPADDATRTKLAQRGLAGKDVAGAGAAGLVRLSVPLSVERCRAVDVALGAGVER